MPLLRWLKWWMVCGNITILRNMGIQRGFQYTRNKFGSLICSWPPQCAIQNTDSVVKDKLCGKDHNAEMEAIVMRRIYKPYYLMKVSTSWVDSWPISFSSFADSVDICNDLLTTEQFLCIVQIQGQWYILFVWPPEKLSLWIACSRV